MRLRNFFEKWIALIRGAVASTGEGFHESLIWCMFRNIGEIIVLDNGIYPKVTLECEVMPSRPAFASGVYINWR